MIKQNNHFTYCYKILESIPFCSFFSSFFLLSFIILGLTATACSDDPEKNKNDTSLSAPGTPIPESRVKQDPPSPEETKLTAPKKAQSISAKTPSNQPIVKQVASKSLGDWDAIRQQGVLRIIIPDSLNSNDFFPRKTSTYIHEFKLIERFCKIHNLTPVFIKDQNFSHLLNKLNQGLGDLVIANLTVTPDRKKVVDFSIPVDHAIEQLVVANSFNKKISRENLGSLKIGVRSKTSFFDTLSEIKKKQNDIQLINLGGKITADDKFDLLNSGVIDAIVEDSNRLILFKEYRKDIKIILNLGEERPIAWAVRKSNPQLLQKLNRFIKTEKLLQHLPETRLGDLDTIKKNRQLRLITRNNPSSYFLWKNQLMGFEYELIRKFALQQKLNLKVIVANDLQQMFTWLKEGYGDIVSAGLVITPEREQLPVKFSNPYLSVQEIIVQRKDEKVIESIKELGGRTFSIRKSSSYWNTLNKIQQHLQRENIHFTIEVVPESMETEEIIRGVSKGQYDLTLADSHIIAIESNWHNNIQASLSLTDKLGQRWVTRNTDKKLLSELNKFIKKEYRGLFYNITYNKYFKNSRRLFSVNARHKDEKEVSPHHELIKSLSSEYDFDWRLITAQVNKESQFNPKAKSWAGAKGLLQVMPRTAREVNIKNLEHPENGLRAGLKYMKWINHQLSDELPPDVKTWFTLVAYNAGLGHLKDARNLAVKKGLNPNRWFGNVEKAILLLANPKYYKNSRYGYVRGIEPVIYVKRIQALYELYSKKHADEV